MLSNNESMEFYVKPQFHGQKPLMYYSQIELSDYIDSIFDRYYLAVAEQKPILKEKYRELVRIYNNGANSIIYEEELFDI